MASWNLNRRSFFRLLAAPILHNRSSGWRSDSSPLLDYLKAGWSMPPKSCRPHTRWWWPGNAVTPEGISWQLEQMSRQGMGGVEIMSCWRWYEKGYIAYLSPEWKRLVRHAIREAARRDMEVALTFGPGWSFGGFWVPPEDRSKVLACGWTDVQGPAEFDGPLPEYEGVAKRQPFEGLDWLPPDHNRIVAVVAARRLDQRLDGTTLTDLTSRVQANHLRWKVPEGTWRIMAFRLLYTGQQNQAQNYVPHNWVVDHMNKSAVQRYCNFLIQEFADGFGDELGKTVDSFFCDSFEIHPLPNTLLWSTDTLQLFRKYKGYDLTPYLPAIWFDIGELTPKIRYDVNEFLHWLGLEATFRTFIEASAARGVEARIQPHYRFTEEIIQGAGLTPRPETEVTTARFATVADPRKSTAAGAHFYGREIVSAEAYTFVHPERYRTTLQDLKIATDAFLRDGVTQFYNHGYVYSPEMDVAPSRDVPWANRISHWNTWWPYYRYLAQYISRCCFLLRQGKPVADVLLYSPQATVWTQRVLFGSERRIMPYGNVPLTLIANGYDYEPVNDDVLQHRARAEKGRVRIRDMEFRFLILPRILALPVKTLEFMKRFVDSGGILIALDRLPETSVGLKDYEVEDQRVRQLVHELFGTGGEGRQFPRGGRTYYLPEYKIIQPEFTPQEQPYEPPPPLSEPQKRFLQILREHCPPDVSLPDFQQSDGLAFLHRQIEEIDVYFLTNLSPKPVRTRLRFRVWNKWPECWDPYTGDVRPVPQFHATTGGIEVPVSFEPWESTLILFRPGEEPWHVTECNLECVQEVTPELVTGLARQAGNFTARVERAAQVRKGSQLVASPPEPLAISGPWRLVVQGVRFPPRELRLDRLIDWTERDDLRYFSGTGTYETEVEVPEQLVQPDLELVLELGAVGHVAEVFWNQRHVGVCWMQPYRLVVTPHARPGRNQLRVRVTNLLINHVAGLEAPPPVPADLLPHYGEEFREYTQGRTAFEKRDRLFRPLPPSGLIGPVQLVALRRVRIPLS